MLHEAVEALSVKQNALYIDGTLGGGGHTQEILSRGGSVLAIDRDLDAINNATQRFSINLQSPTTTSPMLIHGNFKDVFKQLISLKKVNAAHGKTHTQPCSQYRELLPHIDCIKGIILDLGVSSHQIDEKNRGFSYMADAAIDMRMDNSADTISAFDIVNSYTEDKLLKILYEYGEEKNAKKIVRAIIAARAAAQITTTRQLSELIIKCFPPFVKGGHPAKRTFQALRIEVNRELDALDTALIDALDLLKTGGRLAVITFHSLEDRIVKNTFKHLAEDCICNKSIPICICNNAPKVRQINKGTKPSVEELQKNLRAKSATLRVVEKL